VFAEKASESDWLASEHTKHTSETAQNATENDRLAIESDWLAGESMKKAGDNDALARGPRRFDISRRRYAQRDPRSAGRELRPFAYLQRIDASEDAFSSIDAESGFGARVSL
jgi:hypothetical protein